MGPFTAYYLKIYDQHDEKVWFLSWNWVAFFSSFFGGEILWLLYRRMYLFAFLISFLGRGLYELLTFKVIILSHSAGGPLLAKSINWIFRLGFTFGFTVIANALYFYWLSKKVEQGVKKKGTDPFTPIIFFIIHVYIMFVFLPGFLAKNTEIATLIKSVLGGT